MRNLVVIKLRAGIQKLAAARGDLLRRVFQVFAKMAAERHGEFVKGDDVAASFINLIQGMVKAQTCMMQRSFQKESPRASSSPA